MHAQVEIHTNVFTKKKIKLLLLIFIIISVTDHSFIFFTCDYSFWQMSPHLSIIIVLGRMKQGDNSGWDHFIISQGHWDGSAGQSHLLITLMIWFWSLGPTWLKETVDYPTFSSDFHRTGTCRHTHTRTHTHACTNVK